MAPNVRSSHVRSEAWLSVVLIGVLESDGRAVLGLIWIRGGVFSGFTPSWVKGFGPDVLEDWTGGADGLGCDSCSEGFGVELSEDTAGTADDGEDELAAGFAAGWPPSLARRFARICWGRGQ